LTLHLSSVSLLTLPGLEPFTVVLPFRILDFFCLRFDTVFVNVKPAVNTGVKICVTGGADIPETHPFWYGDLFTT
jgi:hypothetical protein